MTQGDLMTIAEANNIKKGAAIIKTINKVVVNWNSYAKKANVKNQLTQTIAEPHLKMH